MNQTMLCTFICTDTKQIGEPGPPLCLRYFSQNYSQKNNNFSQIK